MDYVFTVRRVRKGKFTNEPGSTYFLKVPGQAKDISPDQRVGSAGTGMPDKWAKEVMAQAKSGTDPETGEPVGDIVIYVHGFNTPTPVMLERTRKIRKGLAAHGFEGAVVSFDWPSASTALNYLEDRSDAKQTARLLVDAGIAGFAKRQTADCKINVHLLAHSMGAFVVREAFDDADDRPAIAGASWSVSQVLLVSGDVSASSMEANNPKSSSLYRHCVRLTNYSNPMDAALSLSNVKRVGVSPRVGRVGLPANRPGKAVEVDTGPYFKANRDKFDGLANASHTWYFDDDVFYKDAFETLRGDVDRNMIAARSGRHSQLHLTG
jgi:pimeloyl-ACP methyl ester carboxylesterase